MRRLRDGEVAVEGDKVVEQIGPSSSADKGKGKATDYDSRFGGAEESRTGATSSSTFGVRADPTQRNHFANQPGLAERQAFNAQFARDQARDYAEMDSLWEGEDKARGEREQGKSARNVFQGDGGLTEDDLDERTEEMMHMDSSVPLASSNWEEDFDATMISGGHAVNAPTTTAHQPSFQQKEWDMLQDSWDSYEATTAGIVPVASTSSQQAAANAAAGYAFAPNNPYVSTTRTHAMHAQRSTYDSVLEREAAVQRNPTDPQQWLALGIKQQENEREELAIKALTRALELDPTLGAAYLALAVSYTNENERSMAYEAIDHWIDSLASSSYAREIDNYRDLFGKLPDQDHGIHRRHEYLTGLLIQVVQSHAGSEGADVDAEVQIGLGILFNTSEEYDKASDCFESALSVRPDVRSNPSLNVSAGNIVLTPCALRTLCFSTASELRWPTGAALFVRNQK